MTETYGYARISTSDQNHNLQIDALVEAGVPRKNIVRETISGSVAHKPKFSALLDKLKSGDRLIVWKVDRLGRSVRDALDTAEARPGRGADYHHHIGHRHETPAGKLVFGLLAQIAEFEKELLRERITAGLAAVRRHAAPPWAGHTHSPRTSARRRRAGSGQEGNAGPGRRPVRALAFGGSPGSTGGPR